MSLYTVLCSFSQGQHTQNHIFFCDRIRKSEPSNHSSITISHRLAMRTNDYNKKNETRTQKKQERTHKSDE